MSDAGASGAAPGAQVELGRGAMLPDEATFQSARRAVLALLQSERYPLSVAVTMAPQIPRLALEFIGAMKKIPGGLAAYPLVRYFADQASGEKQPPFRAQLEAITAHKPDRIAGWRRLADIVTILTMVASERSRAAMSLEIVGNKIRSRRGLDEFRWLALDGLAARPRDIVSVAFPIGNPDLTALMRAELTGLVREGDLLREAGLSRGLGMLAAAFALIREVARARAIRRGAETVTPEDLSAAAAMIADTVFKQPRVKALLSRSCPQRRALDRILGLRHFAASVVLPLEPGSEEIRFLESRRHG